MSKDTEEFRWTPELTKSFIHVRLQHEWLFKKKKQAWKDLHKIMLENDFPMSITTHHLRKKWTYTFDEYHKALANNNPNWLYFDIFHSYLGESNSMEEYPNWTDKWINKLIEIRSQNESSFEGNSKNDSWNVVECELRKKGLPIECSVRKVDQIWNSLIKAFKTKYRFYSDGLTSKYVWPFFGAMKNYYESHNPKVLVDIKIGRFKKNEDLNSEDDSDNECLNNIKANILKKCKKEPDHINNESEIKPEDEDFRWTKQWTESFLHIRLQNEELFKQKKQAWKDLHAIMMKNGFPELMTVRCIRRKWSATFEDYQKALTLNNTKWIYYEIFNGYLGDGNTLDYSKNWSDNWIRRLILINIKLQTNLINTGKKNQEDVFWTEVETELRREGLPAEYSVRNLNLIWLSLAKTFKIKHRYILKKKATGTWPFYNDMKLFYEKCDIKTLTQIEKSKKIDSISDCEKSDNDDTFDCKDIDNSVEIKEPKDETLYLICRTCMGTSEGMTPLHKLDDGMSFCDKLRTCTSVQVLVNDSFPQLLCQTCVDELLAAYKFKRKCEETDLILKSTWFSQKDGVKNIKLEMPLLEPTLDELDKKDFVSNIIQDNASIDYYSDNDLGNEVMKDEGFDSQIEEKSIKVKRKRLKLQEKIVPKKRKVKTKSKNVVLIPVVKESGETVYKRRYVYWKVCDICGKSTQRMTEHMKGHSTVKSHKCPLCPKTFTYSASLQTHIRTHDTTPLKVCQLCGREFYRNLTYKRHLIYHANERKFSCETCGKTFNTGDILRIHIRSHTGERPYSCATCGKSFYSRGCVSRHQKVHRKTSVIK